MNALDTMRRLLDDGIVDEVVQRVKTGKEAEVFVVRRGAEYLAAKVYKDREARSFKNNAGYTEGRSTRSSRDARAMARGSTYGRKIAESEWITTEYDALSALFHAGVRVPKPELFYEGVLLMELVLNAGGEPAPRLIDCAMGPDEAVAHHRDLLGMVVRMLSCDMIHGDLSPFNILLAWNGCTIIDLPQVVRAAHNQQAREYLLRDVRNLTDHFARFAPILQTQSGWGDAIWNKYVRRELRPDELPELREAEPRRTFGGHMGRSSEGDRRPPRPAPRPAPPRSPAPPAAPAAAIPAAIPVPAPASSPSQRPAEEAAATPTRREYVNRPAGPPRRSGPPRQTEGGGRNTSTPAPRAGPPRPADGGPRNTSTPTAGGSPRPMSPPRRPVPSPERGGSPELRTTVSRPPERNGSPPTQRPARSNPADGSVRAPPPPGGSDPRRQGSRPPSPPRAVHPSNDDPASGGGRFGLHHRRRGG